MLECESGFLKDEVGVWVIRGAFCGAERYILAIPCG